MMPLREDINTGCATQGISCSDYHRGYCYLTCSVNPKPVPIAQSALDVKRDLVNIHVHSNSRHLCDDLI